MVGWVHISNKGDTTLKKGKSFVDMVEAYKVVIVVTLICLEVLTRSTKNLNDVIFAKVYKLGFLI